MHRVHPTKNQGQVVQARAKNIRTMPKDHHQESGPRNPGQAEEEGVGVEEEKEGRKEGRKEQTKEKTEPQPRGEEKG